MVEKDFELELDIQYIKGVINSCTCVYNDTKAKLSVFNKEYKSRKDFIITQFRGIFLKDFRY